MVGYFTPFLTDFSLAPENCRTNLNIVDVMNDNKHYHVFSTRYITDKKYKSFYLLHLLQEILLHEAEAKHPIIIYFEEIRYLAPASNEGYTKFIAEELKNTMTRMRNMGRGIAIVATTQAFTDVHRSVFDSFNEYVWGELTLKELEAVSKAFKLNKQDTDLFRSLQIGDFIIQTKEEYEDEPSMQRVKFLMPPHAHKDVESQDFFTLQERLFPERMQTYNSLVDEIMSVRQQGFESVELLKDKENIGKRDALKQEKEGKMEREKLRIKVQMQKLQKGTEKKEAVDDKMKNLIYNEWLNATGNDKSYGNIAKKFNLLIATTGEPNKMAVKRAIDQIERKKKALNETTSSPQIAPSLPVEVTPESPELQSESEENETETSDDLFDDVEHRDTE